MQESNAWVTRCDRCSSPVLLLLQYHTGDTICADVGSYAMVLAEQQVYHLSDSSATNPATLRTPAASACCCCSYTTGSTEATSRRSSTAWQAITLNRVYNDIRCVQLDCFNALYAASAPNAAGATEFEVEMLSLMLDFVLMVGL